jgi:hypothetical protein
MPNSHTGATKPHNQTAFIGVHRRLNTNRRCTPINAAIMPQLAESLIHHLFDGTQGMLSNFVTY